MQPTVAQLMREVRIVEEARRFPEALAAIEQAIAVAPRDPNLLIEKAVVLRALGRPEEAREAARAAAKLAPTAADAHAQVGLAFLDQRKLANAESAFKVALQYDRANASALGGYGMLRLKQKRLAEAESFLVAAVRARPSDSNLLVQLGDVFAARSNTAGMIEAYRRAHDVDVLNTEATDKYLAAKQAAGGLAAVRSALEEAVSRMPDLPKSHAQLGHFLAGHGMLDDAAASFRRAVDLDPVFVEGLQFLSVSKQFASPDEQDFVRIAEGYRLSAPGSGERSAIAFAHAKALDDVKDYIAAFDIYREANDIVLKGRRFELDREERAFAAIQRTFTAELLSQYGGAGQKSAAPVFIVGMPRSGTTLTETILSRHPAVHAAGELEEMRANATAIIGASPIYEAPQFAKHLKRDALEKIGSAYLAQLSDEARNSTRFTDKMPHNFRLVGLIRLVFPNAHIVHVRRDPVDTCLSMFKSNFEMPNLDFARDLTTAGRYYNLYRRLMQHWRTLLAGEFFEIDYEALVSHPATSTKALFAYCGLDWFSDVLDIEKSTHEVKTASLAQVRQPINTRSVSTAARYGDRLDPLRAALAEYSD